MMMEWEAVLRAMQTTTRRRWNLEDFVNLKQHPCSPYNLWYAAESTIHCMLRADQAEESISPA